MKRNLHAEIAEGFDALAAQRAGKRTLRTVTIAFKPAPKVGAAELVALRERPNSRGPCLLVIFEPTPGPWRTGNKDARVQTRRQHC